MFECGHFYVLAAFGCVNVSVGPLVLFPLDPLSLSLSRGIQVIHSEGSKLRAI